MGTTAKSTERNTRQMARSFDRFADKSQRKIAELTAALQRFEHERATAQLDVDIAGAEAKIRILKHELRTLTTAQAQKELGDLGLVAADLTTKLGGGGGGGPGGVVGAAAGAGGGGLRGSLLGVTGGMGFMAAAAIAALPAIVALTGAASALVGSLGAAAGGAGALGVGAIGAFAVGLGSIIAVAKPAINDLKELKKAQEDYNKQVQQYGRDSSQAARAQRTLRTAQRQQPGAARVLQNVQVLSRRWRQQTGPAREDFFGILNEGIRTALELLPTFSSIANRILGATRRAASDLRREFTRGEWRGIFRTLGETFSRGIGPAARGISQLALFFGRVARAASPLVIQLFESFERWMRGLARSASNQGRVQRVIGGLVDQLKSWARFFGAVVRLAATFFGAGAQQGQSVLEGITEQLDKWTRWLEEHPGEVQDFFTRTIDSAGKLVSALGEVAATLGRIADALLPILNIFSQIVSMAGGAGMLGPLALLGGLRVAGVGKGMFGGLGKGGGRGGAAPGAGVAATGVSRATGAEVRAGRTGSGAFLMGPAGRGAAGARPGAALMGRVGQFGGPLAIGAGLAATYAGSRIAQGGHPGLGGALSGAATGAGVGAVIGSAVPVLGTGIGAAVGGVIGGGVGFLRGRTSRDEARAQGTDTAAGFVGGGRTTGAIQGQVGHLERLLAATTTRRNVMAPAGQQVIVEPKLEGAARSKVQAELDALKPVLRAQVKAEGEQAGSKSLDDILAAFDIRSTTGRRRGRQRRARIGLLDDIRDNMKKLGPEGRTALRRNLAEWTGQMETGTAGQRRAARRTKDYIIDQYRAMGKRVRVVNGEILKGSTTEWHNIEKALGGSAERARQEVDRQFTALQRKAAGSLVAMGYSQAEANDLIRKMERGSRKGASASDKLTAQRAAGAATPGGAAAPPMDTSGRGGGNARGGRLSGVGTADYLPVAAPGELVVNRHTEARADQKLGAPGSLARLVAGEKLPHGARTSRAGGDSSDRRKKPQLDIMPGLAYGGRLAKGGRAGNIGSMIAAADAIDSRGYPYVWGGGHNKDFSGPYDCSGAVSAVLHAGGLLNSPVTSGTLAGMYAPGPGEVTIYANAGHTYMTIGGRAFGTSTSNPKGGAGWFAGGARPGFAVRHVPLGGEITPGQMAFLAGLGGGGAGGVVPGIPALQPTPSKLKGVPGALSNRAGAVMAGAMTDAVNRQLSATGALPGGGDGGDGGGGVMTFNAVAALAEAAGLPGIAFAQIAKGESGFNPRAVGHDPGGTRGLGLWQITTGFNDDIIKRFGGEAAMFNPQINAQAAKAIYDRAGIGAWYGTRYLTDPTAHFRGAYGGRIPEFAGWHARGGDFTVNKPTLIGAGDRGKERVTIQPIGRGRGGRAGRIGIHIEHLHNHEPGDIAEILERELAKVADEILHGSDDSELD